jgi:carnitine-CoA ligase
MLALGPPENWSVGQRDTAIDALDRAVAKHPDRILLDIGGDFFT